MGKKFKWTIRAAVCLWTVALIQIIGTRVYVSGTGFAQAFARSQLTVERENRDSANLREDNTCLEGYVAGRLDEAECERLAGSLFRTMGGGIVMDSAAEADSSYYTAYGYTNGFSSFRKINGRRINLNVAMRYNEEKDRTDVTIGTPIINSDF